MTLKKNLCAIVLAGALPFGMAAQTYQRPDVAPSQNPGVPQSQGPQVGNHGVGRDIPRTIAMGQTRLRVDAQAIERVETRTSRPVRARG
jgi:hypothetical protein